jgi:2-polyprenyl-6-methoxyphenol hydroxylase-like FAD-dependent oxidoreductase
MSSTPTSPSAPCVTIVGAGLGGLTLALALHKFGIPSKLVELRAPGYDFGGAIMLSPNALRVLDALDAYRRVRGKGFSFRTLTFKTDGDLATTGQYYFGDAAMYGYDALRIYRSALIAELRAMVQEKGIAVEYGRKFSHVVSEDERGVTFVFADGTTETAALLIGADGIHSKVRKYIAPDIVPLYSGFLGVTYAFPRANLRLPKDADVPFPVSIHGTAGAYVLAPQNSDGAEMFAGRQFLYPMQDRSGWDALLKDKAELVEMHQRDAAAWSSDLVRSGQEQASSPDAHSFNIWPFHTLPRLPTWSSERGRVVVLGDAAHAIPPTAGQGANQAFEDSYSLALLLRALPLAVDLSAPLRRWREYRQGRVDRVLELSEHMNALRLSEEEKAALSEEQARLSESYNVGLDGELGWLYMNDIEQDMARVLD